MAGTLVRGCRCATSWSDLDLTFDLAVVTLTYKIWVWVCCRHVSGHGALSNQSSRYWWIWIPLACAMSFTSLTTFVNSTGVWPNQRGGQLTERAASLGKSAGIFVTVVVLGCESTCR